MVAVSKNRRVFSFDVFDTCLARLCGDPRHVFEVLSLRLQAMMDGTCNEHMRQLFVAARMSCGGHNLEEIYRQVAERFPLPCDVVDMVGMELAVERDLLVPIEATRRLVDEVRQKGDILFISDMYLPDDFIREQLSRHGFFREGDRLYVSETVGASKYDGALFRMIHEREGIPYRKWYHYGDNRQSDYKTPRRLGIHAHHLHYDYLFYEEQWMQQPTVGFQYPSILAGLGRAVRLQSEASEDQARFVADLSAPFMTAWVTGIMQDARQRGIRRLYFLARDVHSEYLIAKSLQCLYPEVEIRYLMLSCRSLYGNERVSAYLEDQGLFDHVPSAIVDSCSSGRTKAVLNDLLASRQCPPLHGYFIVKLKTEMCPKSDTGDYQLNDGYLTRMTPKKVNRVLGMRILFELLFSLNYHPTVVDYEYHGHRMRPVLGKDETDRWGFDQMSPREAKRNNDQMLLRYAEAYVLMGLPSQNTMVMERLSLPTLLDFVDRPRKDYLDYLHHFLWVDRPFVGKVRGSKKGVWKRGNRAFTAPSWLMNRYYAWIKDQNFRKKINRIVSWMPLPK